MTRSSRCEIAAKHIWRRVGRIVSETLRLHRYPPRRKPYAADAHIPRVRTPCQYPKSQFPATRYLSNIFGDIGAYLGVDREQVMGAGQSRLSNILRNWLRYGVTGEDEGRTEMDERKGATIIDCFDGLEDPRIERSKRHKLLDIIAIAICATICGADSWVHVELFGRSKEEWFSSFLELPNGIPSHDTFGAVFSRHFRSGLLPAGPGPIPELFHGMDQTDSPTGPRRGGGD